MVEYDTRCSWLKLMLFFFFFLFSLLCYIFSKKKLYKVLFDSYSNRSNYFKRIIKYYKPIISNLNLKTLLPFIFSLSIWLVGWVLELVIEDNRWSHWSELVAESDCLSWPPKVSVVVVFVTRWSCRHKWFLFGSGVDP